MDITEDELQEAQEFLSGLLETTRREAILTLISTLRAQKCPSALTLRYLETLLKEAEINSIKSS